jgi:hypothetical protein
MTWKPSTIEEVYNSVFAIEGSTVDWDNRILRELLVIAIRLFKENYPSDDFRVWYLEQMLFRVNHAPEAIRYEDKTWSTDTLRCFLHVEIDPEGMGHGSWMEDFEAQLKELREGNAKRIKTLKQTNSESGV